MSTKNLNKPRPRWAKATARLIRVTAMTVSGVCFAADSMIGLLIANLGLAVSEFILELFPPDSEEINPRIEEDVTETQINH